MNEVIGAEPCAEVIHYRSLDRRWRRRGPVVDLGTGTVIYWAR